MAFKAAIKENGIKRYDRITDINKYLTTDEDVMAFKHKDADIIRAIVDNTKVTDVVLTTFKWDVVERGGSDRYDAPDYVYGVMVEYKQPINKHFCLFGEYVWHSAPKEHYYGDRQHGYIRVMPIGLSEKKFGKHANRAVETKMIYKAITGSPIDTKDMTSIVALARYKARLMKLLSAIKNGEA